MRGQRPVSGPRRRASWSCRLYVLIMRCSILRSYGCGVEPTHLQLLRLVLFGPMPLRLTFQHLLHSKLTEPCPFVGRSILFLIISIGSKIRIKALIKQSHIEPGCTQCQTGTWSGTLTLFPHRGIRWTGHRGRPCSPRPWGAPLGSHGPVRRLPGTAKVIKWGSSPSKSTSFTNFGSF